MAAPGEKSFCVLEYHTLNLWLLCNVHFVQITQRTRLLTRPFMQSTDHCSSEEYRCTHIDACMARTLKSYLCVPCHPWCTHPTSLVVKNNFFSFPVAVNNSIKVRPLVFLLQMFVITDNIMKHSVLTKLIRSVFKVSLGSKHASFHLPVFLYVFAVYVLRLASITSRQRPGFPCHRYSTNTRNQIVLELCDTPVL
jgi:hypothetical protein